jgi:uncharacterized protein (TIGR02302 family)
MTRFIRRLTSLIGSDRTGRFVFAARLILWFEGVWPRLWPAGGIVGVFLAVAFFGLLPLVCWPLHALVLAGFVTAIGLSLYFSFRDFSPPTWHDAARRLECDSTLNHRPISEADDRLAAGRGDPIAEELWAEHVKDRIRHLGRLRLAPPRFAFAGRDPFRLRYAVLAAVGLSLILSWGHWAERLMSAFGPGSQAAPTYDAWIDPPAYTNVAPVYLADQPHRIAIPAGSILNVRVHGAEGKPFLSLQSSHFPWFPIGSARFEGEGGEYAVRWRMIRNAHVQVRAIGRTIGSWIVDVIPDRPPSVAFTAPPGTGERASLKLSFAARDDYAVTQVRALISPTDGHGETLFLDLGVPPGKRLAETVYRDLTSHPYAGLAVDIALEATDAAGQKAVTAPMRCHLPQLVFTDPLARALIELRRMLAQNGFSARAQVMRTLEAFSIAPERFYVGQLGVYLGLRNGFWALKKAVAKADLDRVVALFWQMATALEHGGLMPLAENLRRIQQALAQMMAEGAPQDQIDAMLARYAEAMQQYLQAMGQDPDQQPGQSDSNAKMLEPKDLADLLAAIQTLSQSGDREKAEQLLSFLQNLIETMRVSGAGGAGGTGGGAPVESQALRDLSDLTGRQRQLLDKTFRRAQGAGDPKDGGKMGLARQQGALKDELNGILSKQKTPSADLKRAERLMDESQKALALGDLLRSGTLQKNALEALRQAATTLARQGAGQAGAQGSTDPLGRATGGRQMPIPDAQVLKRARDILMELRKKAGEMNRPKEERDYIERLLKQF